MYSSVYGGGETGEMVVVGAVSIGFLILGVVINIFLFIILPLLCIYCLYKVLTSPTQPQPQQIPQQQPQYQYQYQN